MSEVNHPPKTLHLSGKSIIHISKIEGLELQTDAEVVDLSYNQIVRIDGLERFTNLRQLYIGHNNITKIEGLDRLANLEILCLDHNNIDSIEGLGQNKQLRDLDLSYNKITKIENLAHLLNLKVLKLQHNQITSYDGIHALPLLDFIDLSSNPAQFDPSKYYPRNKGKSKINAKVKRSLIETLVGVIILLGVLGLINAILPSLIGWNLLPYFLGLLLIILVESVFVLIISSLRRRGAILCSIIINGIIVFALLFGILFTYPFFNWLWTLILSLVCAGIVVALLLFYFLNHRLAQP